MKKAIAEFIGTFALVLVGCGAAVIGGMGSGATSIDILGIAAAFGLTIVAMAYGIGQVSGCHVNPAVSFGVLVAGRMTTSDFITYVIAQVLGAIAGAAVLYLILSGKASGWSGSLGQNGWGPGYLGEYNTASAFLRSDRHVPVSRLHPRRDAKGRAGGACWLGDRLDTRRDSLVRHQHHRHVGQPCPIVGPGTGRRGHESNRARPDVAVYRGPADRGRHRRLSIQVRHPRRRRCDSGARRWKIRRGARGLGAAQARLTKHQGQSRLH
jgi:hypothetical protein